ncbi:MAG: putative glutamine amidotransferase [Solirubrobacteraceae bacterium]|nr:putative glutamine amidotransferase [Solirubrobacteraceae bacterium]
MARPLIGICTALEPAAWGAWSQPAHLLPHDYADAVTRAGGRPLLIPPPPEGEDVDADGLLDVLDGLVLAGGADMEPSSYGAEAHELTLGTCPPRDTWELELARRAVERDLPVLAICRGLQVLNVAAGGTLHQHLPDVVGHDEHRRTVGSFLNSEHDVDLAEGSLAREAAGEAVHETKSHHHQGVDRVGEGLVVSGRSAIDELPEALEMPDRRFVLGVQWHPEVDDANPVIRSFVRAAAGLPAAAPAAAPPA